MDAKTYIENYANNNHADNPTWLGDKIQQKIKSVGGLLTEEGAIMVIAGEHGWVMAEVPQEAAPKEKQYAPITQYTELTDYCLDLIWDTTAKGDEYRKFPKEPLVVKILKIYDAKKPEFGFAKMQTGVKITDGKNDRYFNFEDKEQFSVGDRSFPANLMSAAVQQVRSQLLGKTIAIFNWELFKGKKGFQMSSTSFTWFKVIDPANFEANGVDDVAIVDELYDEVDIDELLEAV